MFHFRLLYSALIVKPKAVLMLQAAFWEWLLFLPPLPGPPVWFAVNSEIATWQASLKPLDCGLVNMVI